MVVCVLPTVPVSSGAHPRNFSIHPSGSWVLVANQDAWPSWGVPAREAVDEGACWFACGKMDSVLLDVLDSPVRG